MKNIDSFIAQFTSLAKGVEMSERTRTSMRERLSAYADMHPVSPLPSPKTISHYFGIYAFRATFAVVLVAVGATGIVQASEKTVPGNVLYNVKVGVVEPLEGVLIVGAKSRATWNAILAERRLSEAAVLAVADTLDAPTREYLGEKFETFAERSNTAADEVHAEGDITGSLALRSDLEARLSAHADLLAYLSEGETESESRALLAVVEETRDAISADREVAEFDASAETLAYAESDIDAVARATDEITELAVGAGVSENVAPRLVEARAAIALARSSLAINEQGDAYVAAQTATRLTHEVAILARNKDIVALGAPTVDMSATMMAPSAKEVSEESEEVVATTTATTTASTTEEKPEHKEKNELFDSVKSFIGL